jgi:uncharacterized protein YidB (DUF937 family)
MEKLDSENKQYLLSVLKPKAIELSYTALEKFIETDPNKPVNFQEDEIDDILGDLFVNKIGTKTGQEKKSIINDFLPSEIPPDVSTLTLRKSIPSSKGPLESDIVLTANP